MKGSPEQTSVIISEEVKPKEEKTPLVLYKQEERLQLSPPVTRTFYWFWTPKPPPILESKGVLPEIGKRIERFCQEEGKKVIITLFTGVIPQTEREESLILVEVSRLPLSEQARTILMMNAPEPPRAYPQEEKIKSEMEK